MKKTLLLAMLFPAIAFARPIPCAMDGKKYIADVSIDLESKAILFNQSIILPLDRVLIGGNGRAFLIEGYKGDHDGFGFVSGGHVVACLFKGFPKEYQVEY